MKRPSAISTAVKSLTVLQFCANAVIVINIVTLSRHNFALFGGTNCNQLKEIHFFISRRPLSIIRQSLLIKPNVISPCMVSLLKKTFLFTDC